MTIAYGCLVVQDQGRRCEHFQGCDGDDSAISDPNCGFYLMRTLVSRMGDPTLLRDTEMACKFFPVRASDEQAGTFGMAEATSMPFSEFVSKLHPSFAGSLTKDPEIFDSYATNDALAAAILVSLKIYLSAMGLRFCDPDSSHLISSDIDRPEAVEWRRNGWADCADLNGSSAEAASMRTVLLIMMSMASFGRTDLAVELFAILTNERFAKVLFFWTFDFNH
jgi:hypothetical protein